MNRTFSLNDSTNPCGSPGTPCAQDPSSCLDDSIGLEDFRSGVNTTSSPQNAVKVTKRTKVTRTTTGRNEQQYKENMGSYYNPEGTVSISGGSEHKSHGSSGPDTYNSYRGFHRSDLDYNKSFPKTQKPAPTQDRYNSAPGLIRMDKGQRTLPYEFGESERSDTPNLPSFNRTPITHHVTPNSGSNRSYDTNRTSPRSAYSSGYTPYGRSFDPGRVPDPDRGFPQQSMVSDGSGGRSIGSSGRASPRRDASANSSGYTADTSNCTNPSCGGSMYASKTGSSGAPSIYNTTPYPIPEMHDASIPKFTAAQSRGGYSPPPPPTDLMSGFEYSPPTPPPTRLSPRQMMASPRTPPSHQHPAIAPMPGWTPQRMAFSRGSANTSGGGSSVAGRSRSSPPAASRDYFSLIEDGKVTPTSTKKKTIRQTTSAGSMVSEECEEIYDLPADDPAYDLFASGISQSLASSPTHMGKVGISPLKRSDPRYIARPDSPRPRDMSSTMNDSDFSEYNYQTVPEAPASSPRHKGKAGFSPLQRSDPRYVTLPDIPRPADMSSTINDSNFSEYNYQTLPTATDAGTAKMSLYDSRPPKASRQYPPQLSSTKYDDVYHTIPSATEGGSANMSLYDSRTAKSIRQYPPQLSSSKYDDVYHTIPSATEDGTAKMSLYDSSKASRQYPPQLSSTKYDDVYHTIPSATEGGSANMSSYDSRTPKSIRQYPPQLSSSRYDKYGTIPTAHDESDMMQFSSSSGSGKRYAACGFKPGGGLGMDELSMGGPWASIRPQNEWDTTLPSSIRASKGGGGGGQSCTCKKKAKKAKCDDIGNPCRDKKSHTSLDLNEPVSVFQAERFDDKSGSKSCVCKTGSRLDLDLDKIEKEEFSQLSKNLQQWQKSRRKVVSQINSAGSAAKMGDAKNCPAPCKDT